MLFVHAKNQRKRAGTQGENFQQMKAANGFYFIHSSTDFIRWRNLCLFA